MKWELCFTNENGKSICYIIYENGKKIELARCNSHQIYCDNKYVFLILNSDVEKKIDKVFDINNKRYLTKKVEMIILYNKYKQEVKKRQRKLLLENKKRTDNQN